MKSTFIALALIAAPFVAGAGDPPMPGDHDGSMMDMMGEKSLIQKFDKDGDGRVSRAESLQASTERANKRFDEIDTNKDGFLTQDEVSAARQHMRADMRKRAEGQWKAADKDGDGAISRSEAEAGMPMLWKRFDQLDANKDGRVTRDEMPAGKHMNSAKPVQ